MIEKLDNYPVLPDYEVIVNKINEIIDFLNGTYLMDVKDGKFSECGPAIEPITFLTGLSTADCCVNNMVNIEPLKGKVKCPHCGESYYTELYSTSTAVYYPPIYKDGVNINPDMNESITYCKCLNCHKEFTI